MAGLEEKKLDGEIISKGVRKSTACRRAVLRDSLIVLA